MSKSDEHEKPTDDSEPPLYRFSWRRFVVIASALLTLPIWAPWVKQHVGLHEMLLLVPFVIILSVSIWCISFMLPHRSIRRRNTRK
ncbi:MAG: hypothetical protein WBD20_23690 [Pirellulaceae bacterium]